MAKPAPAKSTSSSVGIRELKATLSQQVRRVKQGATVLITEHGRPVARLVPEPPSASAQLRALAKDGLIDWNGKRFNPGPPTAKVIGPGTVSDLVSENRD